MIISVAILDGPLPRPEAPTHSGAGAIVEFAGIVREMENERPLRALHYETYEPMAQNMLEAIARELAERSGLIAIDVMHSRGTVPVGECSFRLMVASAHRREALAAMNEFIDRMKQDVPIWKRPVWLSDSIV